MCNTAESHKECSYNDDYDDAIITVQGNSITSKPWNQL